MTIKCLADGVSIAYLESPHNYKKELRPVLPDAEPTQWVGGYPSLEKEFFKCSAPPHVQENRWRRSLRHCRDHSIQFILGFSERYEDVQALRPLAIRTAECLVAAGLPLEDLDFFWNQHLLREDFHIHGVAMRALLPSGGMYDPALPASLAMDCSYLFSRRLHLSNPLDKLKARLIRGCEFSYQGSNREWIDAVCRRTHERFQDHQLADHAAFLKMIEDEGFGGVNVSPLPDGRPGLRTDQPIGRLYNHAVAVRIGSGAIVWLAGLVCRHHYTAEAARADLRRRRQEFEDPQAVYLRLSRNLAKRIAGQRGRYGQRGGQFPVTLERFEWMNPANYGNRFLSLETMTCSHHRAENSMELPDVAPSQPPIWDEAWPPFVSSAPEITYPYYSDLSDQGLRITDPTPSSADELDELNDLWITLAGPPPAPAPGAANGVSLRPAANHLPDPAPGSPLAGPSGTANPSDDGSENRSELPPAGQAPLPTPAAVPAPRMDADEEQLRRKRKRRALELRIAVASAMDLELRRQMESSQPAASVQTRSHPPAAPSSHPGVPSNSPPIRSLTGIAASLMKGLFD